MSNTRALAATLVALTVAVCAPPSAALAQDAKLVSQWNHALFSVGLPGGPAPSHPAAILHIAMFEAVNAIERAYTPYRFDIRASRGASAEAAAAQAAHDVLTALFPTHQTSFDTLLDRNWRTCRPAGRSRGLRSDRWPRRRCSHGGRTTAGRQRLSPIRPTCSHSLRAIGSQRRRRSALPRSPSCRRPRHSRSSPARSFCRPPPPTLDSERYATAFNETKLLGSVASIARTPEQTEIALRIAAVGFSTSGLEIWFKVAADVARTHNMSLVDTARLFAFVGIAEHDGLQTSVTGKFTYGLWRPVTAIQRADEDGNPLTDPDPAWLPLLSTPTYPTYPGNASCLAAASARALQLALGSDEVPFSVTWVGIPPTLDVTRDYDRFSDLAEEFARSRIYGGIHFQFDSDASQAACPKVAEYAFANYMIER